MAEFAEDEWEGPSFCGKWCFNYHKKTPEVAANKGKGRVSWHTDGPTPELKSMAVIIDWLNTDGNYSQLHGGNKQNGMTKWAFPMN